MDGRAFGLDYAGVAAVAAAVRVRLGPRRFHELRLMENAALVAWAELPEGA